MSAFDEQNHQNTLSLLGSALAKPSDRDVLRDLFEKHADWHDTGTGTQAFIEVECAADLAATWADEQMNPDGPVAA